jgi:hypothetical protein
MIPTDSGGFQSREAPEATDAHDDDTRLDALACPCWLSRGLTARAASRSGRPPRQGMDGSELSGAAAPEPSGVTSDSSVESTELSRRARHSRTPGPSDKYTTRESDPRRKPLQGKQPSGSRRSRCYTTHGIVEHRVGPEPKRVRNSQFPRGAGGRFGPHDPILGPAHGPHSPMTALRQPYGGVSFLVDADLKAHICLTLKSDALQPAGEHMANSILKLVGSLCLAWQCPCFGPILAEAPGSGPLLHAFIASHDADHSDASLRLLLARL